MRERKPFLSATVRERYRFHHALIREVLYGGVSRRRQGQLHERVGWALETVCGHDREAPLEELARHFARAHSGRARERGWRYCLRAGEKARGLSADAEVIQHLQQARRLLDGLPEDEAHWKLRWQATAELAQAHSVRLEWEPARQVVEEYRARAERAGYSWGIARAHGGVALPASTWKSTFGTEGIASWAGAMRKRAWPCASGKAWPTCYPWRRTTWPTGCGTSRGAIFRARELLRQALDCRATTPAQVLMMYTLLTQVYASQRKWDEVTATVRESFAAGGLPTVAMNSLSRWRRGCRRRGEGRVPRLLRRSPAPPDADRRREPALVLQWYLAPAQPCARFSQVAFQDDFEGPRCARNGSGAIRST